MVSMSTTADCNLKYGKSKSTESTKYMVVLISTTKYSSQLSKITLPIKEGRKKEKTKNKRRKREGKRWQKMATTAEV